MLTVDVCEAFGKSSMTLSELVGSMRRSQGHAQADVGEDWLQGRSLFGGLQAVIALSAMRTLIPDDVPLRTLQMTFIAPVPAGSVSASARVLRSGKSATHVEARIENGDDVSATIIGVFGLSRESIVEHDLPAPRSFESRPFRVPYIQGVAPSFMQHFSVELLDGAPPFSGNAIQRAAYRLGLDGDGPLTESHVLALADFVPPVALSWSPKVAPGSSLTWMLEFFDHDFANQSLQGWHVESEMVAARDGYTSQSTTLWTPNGRAVALSRQSMVVFV
jgi:acyl-CoA thioesterase